jgi:hypothetical protein
MSTRGRAQLISFELAPGRSELRWMVPLLEEPRDPRSWSGWAEPTAAELAEVNADRVAGLTDSAGRPRRWLLEDWRTAAKRLDVELPADLDPVHTAMRCAWSLHLKAEAELPAHDELRLAIAAQVNLPY